MADDVKVQVRGLREVQGALRQVSKDAPKRMKEGFKRLATKVADRAASKVPRISGDAAGSIKSRSTATGGSIAFGGKQAPYMPWLDFGGKIRRAERPFIKQGRYIYPTISEMNEEIKRETDHLIAEAIEHAGFDTTGGE